MADGKDDDVKIYEPDRSLHAKIGNANLDQLLPPQVVNAAQDAIQKSSDLFLEESLSYMGALMQSYEGLVRQPEGPKPFLAKLIALSFSIKVSSGLGGYDLVSTLARSLYRQCEKMHDRVLTPKDLEIFKWHIDSIQQLMENRIKGDGGPAGARIIAEIERLSA